MAPTSRPLRAPTLCTLTRVTAACPVGMGSSSTRARESESILIADFRSAAVDDRYPTKPSACRGEVLHADSNFRRWRCDRRRKGSLYRGRFLRVKESFAFQSYGKRLIETVLNVFKNLV